MVCSLTHTLAHGMVHPVRHFDGWGPYRVMACLNVVLADECPSTIEYWVRTLKLIIKHTLIRKIECGMLWSGQSLNSPHNWGQFKRLRGTGYSMSLHPSHMLGLICAPSADIEVMHWHLAGGAQDPVLSRTPGSHTPQGAFCLCPHLSLQLHLTAAHVNASTTIFDAC